MRMVCTLCRSLLQQLCLQSRVSGLPNSCYDVMGSHRRKHNRAEASGLCCSPCNTSRPQVVLALEDNMTQLTNNLNFLSAGTMGSPGCVQIRIGFMHAVPRELTVAQVMITCVTASLML